MQVTVYVDTEGLAQKVPGAGFLQDTGEQT